MAQWFADSASITNLETTSSYIGSGSTSFNKDQSVLYINNGMRQGVNNINFSTNTGNSNHIQGSSNSTTLAWTHIEGTNNTIPTNQFTAGHIEGGYNIGRINYSHIEGIYNSSSDSTIGDQAANHVEGGYNYLNGGRGAQHIEGFSNTGSFGVLIFNHIAGINNKPNMGSQANYIHIRGYNNINTSIAGERQHIEGTDHIASQGAGNHTEGHKHNIQHTNANNVGFNHTEGANHIITQSGTNHISGISCSIGLNNDGYSGATALFVSGLGIKTYYSANSYAYLTGQFNSFSNYPNLSSTNNKVYTNFTIGGGLNNSTRANIFEVALIASASSIFTNITRSIVLPWVSESGNFPDDTTAAAGGVPLGGFYRTGNSLKIRLS